MRLKSKVVMIILLSSMLLLTYFGVRTIDNDNNDSNDDEIVEVVPTTFVGKIDNECNLDSTVVNTITSYLDAYFKSLSTLELTDSGDSFSNDVYKHISDTTISLMIDVRKARDYDMSITSGHFDLRIKDYYKEDGKYYVTIYEDDYGCFSFLGGIESSIYDIRSEYVIDENNKISSFYREQGYFMMFNEEDEETNIQEIDNKYNYYHDVLLKQITYNENVLKPQASEKTYLPNKVFTSKYNRDLAVDYLNKYYHTRNKQWYDYEDEGGNCQNFASQALNAGGIKMDYFGDYQWKCYIADPDYDPEIDESEDNYGRSRSWVNVQYFYDYARYNEDYGLAADVDVNIYYGEPGDIVQVGNGSLSHTTMISKIVDGHILVSGNSLDMKDYPIEASTYTHVCLIKILGNRE